MPRRQVLVRARSCSPVRIPSHSCHSRLDSTGHQGMHGHEFLEFEYSGGRLRYANNSNYRNDSLIRKESAFAGSRWRRAPRPPRLMAGGRPHSVGWPDAHRRAEADRQDERDHQVRGAQAALHVNPGADANGRAGRMTRSGPRRTLSASRSSRSGLTMSTSRSRCVRRGAGAWRRPGTQGGRGADCPMMPPADRQDRLARRRDRLGRPGRPARVLLSCTGSQGGPLRRRVGARAG